MIIIADRATGVQREDQNDEAQPYHQRESTTKNHHDKTLSIKPPATNLTFCDKTSYDKTLTAKFPGNKNPTRRNP